MIRSCYCFVQFQAPAPERLIPESVVAKDMPAIIEHLPHVAADLQVALRCAGGAEEIRWTSRLNEPMRFRSQAAEVKPVAIQAGKTLQLMQSLASHQMDRYFAILLVRDI